jgi:hypothetical protein
MSPFERALVELGARGRATIAHVHEVAIAVGGNSVAMTHEIERTCTAQDLLCLAGDAAVDLAMIAQVFEVAPDGGAQARLLRETAASVARMTARALEVHARDTGYDPDVWIARSLDETEFVMSDDRDELFDGLRAGGESVSLARSTASNIFAALACAPADRMGVPGRVAAALGTSVAVFMIADSALLDG